MAELNLNKAEDVLEKMTKTQAEQLVKMFDAARKEVSEKIKLLGNTKSESLQRMQLNGLVEQLNLSIEQVYKQFEGQLSDSVVAVCKGVLASNEDFLASIGLKMKGAYASVPVDVLHSLRTGHMYDKKWFLSEALWSDLKLKQREISAALAKGLAMNESPLEIAKRLETFVDPSASKMSRRIKTDYYQDPYNAKRRVSASYVAKHPEVDWSQWKKGRSTYYFGRVDYNAQRLARTAIAHAYQQSIVQSTKNNPLATGIRWISAMAERTCEICIERDGKVFSPDDLPLDHPNGMCTYAIELPSMDEIGDRLTDWVNGKEDKGLDSWTESMFGGKFELKQSFNDLQNKYLGNYGFSPSKMPSDFSEWLHGLSSVDKKTLLEDTGAITDPHPFQVLQKWYEEKLAKVGTRTVFTQTTGASAPSKVIENMFSQQRKDAAKWFKGAASERNADAYFRGNSGKLWRAADDATKRAAYDYTAGSESYNRPLRGYRGGWNDYVGPGKVDLDYDGAGEKIKLLEKFIDKSTYADDVWLQRGLDDRGLARFLKIDESELHGDVMSLRSKVVNKVFVDEGFLSCGSVKGGGFWGNIQKVYCPTGTKMVYAEPWSYHSGATYSKLDWDGIEQQVNFSTEIETIIQRGTTYRITKIEKVGGEIYLDMEVVGQI